MGSRRAALAIAGAAALGACGVPRGPSIVGSQTNGVATGFESVAARPTTTSTTVSTPPPPSHEGQPSAQEATSDATSTESATSRATTTTTTTTTTITTTTVPESRRITLAFTGDTLPHSPLWRGAARIAAANGHEGFDFGPMLAGLAPILESADLAVCHLETPIAPLGEEYSTAPFYGVPSEVVDALADAGFDHCSTASNHTMDRGATGIDRTVEVLAAAGISQSGMARTPDEIAPRLTDVDGVAVSLLSYTFSYNGLPAADGEAWRSALIEPERIERDAATARSLGAELVVVSLHWGAEGRHAPTDQQRRIADGLTATGLIDLIVGHHAHVLQPIERVNDRWVLFGLGNIISNLPTSSSWPAASQDAAVAVVDIEVGPDGDVTVEAPVVHPTWVDKQADWTVRVVADELARDDLAEDRRVALEASWERSIAVVGDHVPGSGS